MEINGTRRAHFPVIAAIILPALTSSLEKNYANNVVFTIGRVIKYTADSTNASMKEEVASNEEVPRPPAQYRINLNIYHGIGFSIYFALFVAAGARSEEQSTRFYLTLLRTRWPCTAMITIHTMHLLSLLLLWQGHKRSNSTVLLSWLILFTVMVTAQITIILMDRSSYLLAQIPLLFFQFYCFWVVWELREHFRFMLNTREEIPMMTLIRIDDTVHCNDRADGEIPPSQVESSYERFGYHVYTSTVCGYSMIPKDALEIALGPSSSPAFSAYYRTCFCPIPTHQSRITHSVSSSKPPNNLTQESSRSSVRLKPQQSIPGQRVLSVVSRMEKKYRR